MSKTLYARPHESLSFKHRQKLKHGVIRKNYGKPLMQDVLLTIRNLTDRYENYDTGYTCLLLPYALTLVHTACSMTFE